MGAMKSGYILNGLDKQYAFTYDGELLQLVPKNEKEIRPYDCFIDMVVEKELLSGITMPNKSSIFFLKCRLQRNNSGYIAKPAGYICFDDSVNTFRTMVLKGEVINYFYRPNQILGEGSEYPWEDDGGGKLIIRKFSEITKRKSVNIAGEKADFVVSISRPQFPKFMKAAYSLGSPKSFVRLEFENDIPVEKFAEIYLWIQNFFEFLNFRKSVFVEEIELGTFTQEERISKRADVHLLHKREIDLDSPDLTIGYYFIEGKLDALLNVLNSEKLNMMFIPVNRKEDNYIDPQKYMLCCSSFESVFNYCFPNKKMEENEKFKDAKMSVVKFIEEKDEEYKGKDGAIRKEYGSLKKIIELTDFSLEQKYRWCLREYSDYISDYCERVYQKCNLKQEQIEEIPKLFALKRNILVHSNIESIEKEDVAAYAIMRYLIYFIILEQIGISKELVKNAVESIFL